jgi:integrase
VIQQKTGRPVQFEITEQTRAAIRDWLASAERAGLDSAAYGTHSMRRTKAAQIYKKTGNLRAVQLLLGHTKLLSTVRYLDALNSDRRRRATLLRASRYRCKL